MLLLVAHGTRDPRGVELARQLASVVAADGTDVRLAFADVLGPTVSEVLAELTEPVVVVPAFFAAGYHVRTDVPAQVRASGHQQVHVTAALGPDPVLAQAQLARLHEAGWQPGEAVVLAAVGSADDRALADVRAAGDLLAELLQAPVPVGYLVAAQPPVAEVVAGLRAEGAGRVLVSPYLLAPGLFHTRLAQARADAVAEPVGVHPLLVELVRRRYADALAEH